MTKDVYWIHGVESEAVAPVLYCHSGGVDPPVRREDEEPCGPRPQEAGPSPPTSRGKLIMQC